MSSLPHTPHLSEFTVPLLLSIKLVIANIRQLLWHIGIIFTFIIASAYCVSALSTRATVLVWHKELIRSKSTSVVPYSALLLAPEIGSAFCMSV